MRRIGLLGNSSTRQGISDPRERNRLELLGRPSGFNNLMSTVRLPMFSLFSGLLLMFPFILVVPTSKCRGQHPRKCRGRNSCKCRGQHSCKCWGQHLCKCRGQHSRKCRGQHLCRCSSFTKATSAGMDHSFLSL